MYKILSRQKLWTSFIIIRPKIWSLEHTQSFSKVWASDLVLDPTWPTFKLIRDFMKTNILTNFHDNQTENVASRVYTRFFKRFDLVFDLKWLIFKHNQDLSIKTFWPSFMTIGLKMRPLDYTQGFSKIWSCDLVFDPTWTILELIRDFSKTNILTNFHNNQTENVDSTEYTSQKVSERKNSEVGLLCSYVPSCDPRGGANIDPRGII